MSIDPGWLAFQFRSVELIGGVAHTLLIYDYLLVLSDEIKYMWRPGGGFARMLYLLTRYLSLMSVAGELFFTQLIHPSMPWCASMWKFVGAINMVGIFTSETIFLLRALAHHRQSKRTQRIIWSLYIVTFLTFATLIVLWWLGTSFYAPPDPLRGCGPLPPIKYTYATLSLLAFWQWIITGLAFLKSRRSAATSEQTLVQILKDDGFHYYIFILLTTTGNILLLGGANLQQTISIYRSLTTITATRLLLHVRRIAEQSSGIALTQRHPVMIPGSGNAISAPSPSSTIEQSISHVSKMELVSNSGSRSSGIDGVDKSP